MHQRVAGEQTKRAPASDLQQLLDALRCALDKLRLARVGQIGRYVQQRLALVVEVRFDHQFAGVLDSDTVADVLEASRDCQRCRGEYGRLQVLEQRGAQNVRHRDRRGLEKDVLLRAASVPAIAATLDPEDGVALLGLQDESQVDTQLLYPACQGVYLVGLVGNGLQLGVQVQQRILQAKILVAILFQKFWAVLEREASLSRRKQREEELRPVLDPVAHMDNIGERHIHPPQGVFDIAEQFVHPKVGDRDSKVVGGNVLQLVGFVEDDDTSVGQNPGVGRTVLGCFDRQVGAEQVMIDDDDVALGGAAAHLGNETAVKLLALGADTAVGARVEFGPQMAVLRQFGQLRAVAGFGGLLPVADDAKLVDFFQPVQHRLIGEVVELLTAEIVAATLHVADAQLAEVLLQEGNVFEEELLLQGLGAGGDDDALAGTNDGQQVCQRLAGAGAGFDDQVPSFG